MSRAARSFKVFGLVLAMSALAVFSAGTASAEQVDWVCAGGPTPHPVCVEV